MHLDDGLLELALLALEVRLLRQDVHDRLGEGGPERECAVPDAGGMHFKVFADASFGREVHPFYGGFIEWRNGPLVWYAGKAKFAPQSSCEIETAAMVRMLKEERFAVQVGEFMGIEFDGPTACITDNKATYDIVRNPGATK